MMGRTIGGEAADMGSITIFLSLTLLIMISFVCTALQSAKLAASRYLFLTAAESMVISMYGAYNTDLWQQYRILGLTDQEKAEEIGKACKDAYEKEEGFLRISLDSWAMTDPVSLAGQGAWGWQQSAVSYMEYEIPADLLSKLWEEAGIAEELSGIADGYQEIRSLVEPVIQLEEQIRELEKQYARGRELLQSSQALVSRMAGLVDQAKEWETGQADTETLASIQSLLAEIQQCAAGIQKLSGEKGTFSSLLSQVQEAIPKVEALQKQLSQMFSQLEPEGENPFLSLLADFGGYAEKLTERLDHLSAMPESIQKLIRAGERAAQLQVPSLEEMISGDGIAQLAQWRSFLEELDALSVEESAEEETEAADSGQKSLLAFRNLKEWLSDGFLRVLLPEEGDLSEKRISRTFSRTERAEEAELMELAYENLLYGEYALRYTAQYGEDGGAGLQYETEYLIAGKPSDRENLTAVALSLIGIRSAANLCYLLQDTGAKSQTEAAAAGISAALGGLLPVGIVSIFLLTLWAAAEAVCDVSGLLQGKTVPLWKTDETWNLSWEQLWRLAGNGWPGGKETADQASGMAYEDYLRILLYLTPLQEKCYRTMETAEENLKVSDSSLQLDQAIYQATWSIQGKAAGRDCQISLTYGY